MYPHILLVGVKIDAILLKINFPLSSKAENMHKLIPDNPSPRYISQRNSSICGTGDIYKNSSTVHNTPKLKAIQMSINSRMYRQMCVSTCICIHRQRNDYHKRQVRINGYLWERNRDKTRLLENLQCSIFGPGRFFYGCLLYNYSFQCTFTFYATFGIFVILHNSKNIKKEKRKNSGLPMELP